MRKLPGFQDVNSDQQNGGLDELLTYDRATAARLGITAQALDSTCTAPSASPRSPSFTRSSTSTTWCSKWRRSIWQTPEGLKYIYLQRRERRRTFRSRRGHAARPNTTPLSVNHTGLFPSVTVSFNLALGHVAERRHARIGQMQTRLGMPQTVRGFFAGTLQAYQQSLGTEPMLIAHRAAGRLHRARHSL